MAREMLMPSELSATAARSWGRGTSAGTIDCQVGAINAAPSPPTKVSASKLSRPSAPEPASTISVALTAASSSCTAIRKRRRSRMSDSTPAGIANKKTGSTAAACTAATAAGLVLSSVASQPLATSRMKLPMLPSTVAIHSTAKTRSRSGASAPSVGSAMEWPAALMTSAHAHTAQQAQPSAPQKLRRSDTGSSAAQARAWP